LHDEIIQFIGWPSAILDCSGTAVAIGSLVIRGFDDAYEGFSGVEAEDGF